MTLDIGAPLLAKQTNRKGAGVVTNENPPILKSEITNWRNNNLGGLRERERESLILIVCVKTKIPYLVDRVTFYRKTSLNLCHI